MPKDEMGKDVSVPELAEDTGKKAQNIAKKEGAGRPATPEYNADRVRRIAQGSALNEAGLSFEDVKGDEGGYLYKLNPDKSVTIVYDPTGRASGVTLTPGTRQRTAYEAILKNVYEMEPPPAPGPSLQKKAQAAVDETPAEITAPVQEDTVIESSYTPDEIKAMNAAEGTVQGIIGGGLKGLKPRTLDDAVRAESDNIMTTAAAMDPNPLAPAARARLVTEIGKDLASGEAPEALDALGVIEPTGLLARQRMVKDKSLRQSIRDAMEKYLK